MKYLALSVLLLLAFSIACSTEAPEVLLSRQYFTEVPSTLLDTLEEKQFIKRYTGFLGNDDSIPIQLLLVNWGNGHLTGNLHYQNQQGLLKLDGQLTGAKSFRWTEERFGQLHATFEGIFYGTDSLSGTWWNIDSTKSKPFRFNLQPPEVVDHQWEGAWHLNDPWDTSILIIGGVTEHKLEFAMNIYINDYREEFFGTAKIYDSLAVVDFLYYDYYVENCSLIFRHRNQEIYLDQISFPFLCGLGHNCWINGTYSAAYTGKIPRMDAFIAHNNIFRDSAMYDTWLDIVGAERESWFAYTMEKIDYTRGWKQFHGLEGSIWKGRVRGFHREKEAIITYDKKGNMWTAITTPPTSRMGPMKVHYFTNAKNWKTRMPVFIADWAKDFRNCTIVYESAQQLMVQQ